MTRTAAQPAPAGPGNGPAPARVFTRRRCRVRGCRARIGRDRLMCRPHWYQVPKPLRDQVWAAWRSGAGAATSEYRQAAAQAITAAQAGREGPP
jgi:hypothetical protein